MHLHHMSCEAPCLAAGNAGQHRLVITILTALFVEIVV